MRSRRGLRVRLGPVRVSVVRRRFDGPRTVFARSRRSHRVGRLRFLRARSRVSEVRLVAPTGVATGDASDRLLHSETVPTRALVLRRFPAQRPNPVRCLAAASEGRSRPGALRLRARPRERLLRVLLRPSGDARSRHREARGRPMQTRLGRTALHGALPTSAPGRSCVRAFSSPVRESSPFASDTPVASSVLVGLGRCYAVPTLWLGGRQDRFRGGLVKGVRIPDPGCLPSSVAMCIPAAPKHGRNHIAFIKDAALT